MRPRRALGCLALLVLGTALAAAGAAWWGWTALHRPLERTLGKRAQTGTGPGNGSGEGSGEAPSIVIAPGTDARTILADLDHRGLAVDPFLTRLYLVYWLGDPPLKAGEYRFEEPASTADVLDKLIRGAVVQHRVTVIEGLTLEETADALTDAGFGDRDRFLAAMRDPSLIADLDPDAETLEGYLYPDTYAFSRGVTERDIVATMVRTFRDRFDNRVRPLLAQPGGRVELGIPAGTPPVVGDGLRLDQRAGQGAGGDPGAGGGRPPDEPAIPPDVAASRRLTLTLRELVTLASIVEKEAQLDSERPVIAAVYVNRLLAGMGLYADPTVIYALKRQGTWDGNLRRVDLQIDSPYNTYRYGGLPPGPIASPGVESLRAAADPARTQALYFVSRNDGSHVFADTLREHNRNVVRWQKRYWRDRWARERREKAQQKEPDGR